MVCGKNFTKMFPSKKNVRLDCNKITNYKKNKSF